MTKLEWEDRMADRQEAIANEIKAQERTVSPYLRKPLRSETQARTDLWSAVQSWTSHLNKPSDVYPCGHEITPGQPVCPDCRADEEAKAEHERELERNYRGPCVGKEGR